MFARFLTVGGVCLALLVPVHAANAGVISTACKRSDRDAASRPMCNCIQQVADQMLSAPDQRRAAGFFADPHKSQEVRQSDVRRDEVFWLRYKEFGTIVAASCSHLN